MYLFISSFQINMDTFWKICVKHNKWNVLVRKVAVLNTKFNRKNLQGFYQQDRQSIETSTEPVFRTASGNLENLYAIYMQCIEFFSYLYNSQCVNLSICCWGEHHILCPILSQRIHRTIKAKQLK